MLFSWKSIRFDPRGGVPRVLRGCIREFAECAALHGAGLGAGPIFTHGLRMVHVTSKMT
jgi:hypothetical protein